MCRLQIMASGGMSFPKLGTDGAGLQLLESMGHPLHKPYPALTPLKGMHMSNAQLAGTVPIISESWRF